MNQLVKQYLENGLSVIPITPGAKYPSVKWDIFQQRLATHEEADKWDTPIGIVGGKVSGGICTIDFDDKGSKFHDWITMVEAVNGELVLALTIQQTPSGGYHVVYRCPSVTIGNEKLARMATPNAEGKIDLIETRSEGGQFLVYPSEGYKLIQNDFLSIPVVKKESHDLMIECAKSFNQRINDIEDKKHEDNNEFSLSPFDAFNKDNTPIDILTSHGWTIEYTRGDVVYFKRPGKKERGISASWNHVPERFYVFTTNTEFENEHVYKASAVYTILEHRGDFKAAAKALHEKGFGSFKKQEPYSALIPAIKPEILKYYHLKDIEPALNTLRSDGPPKGYSTGFAGLDKYYMVARGQLNVVTGVPSHGKSEIMDSILVNMAKSIDWKFIVFSPENFPLELHFQKLAEKYMDKYIGNFTDEEYCTAKNFIDKHFIFIPATENGINIANILNTTEEILKTERIDGLLLDPWNEIETGEDATISETQYIGRALSTIRKFSRKHNLVSWVVAHPAKLKKERTSQGTWEYPIPDLYSISGSAHWYNKTDNGIIVWRDFYNKITKIIIQKIKFKYYGKTGELNLKYKTESGNFYEEEGLNPYYGKDNF